MRKGSRRASRPEDALAAVEAPPAEEPLRTVPPAVPPDRPPLDRIAIPLRPDGTIDLDSARPVTRARLKTALADRTLPARLGLTPQAPQASLFAPELMAVLYDAIGSVLVAVARSRGYGVEQASTLAFDEAEKTVLAPLTGAVLDKWLPDAGQWREETMLALALMGIMTGKLALLRRQASVLHVVPPAASAPEQPA